VYLADTLVGLARLLEAEGRTMEALAAMERVLAIKERAFAADHPELGEIRSQIKTLRDANG
jgi:hypothetical protein